MMILLVGGPGQGNWIDVSSPIHTLRIPIHDVVQEIYAGKRETAIKPSFPYTEYHLAVVSIGAYKEYIYLHSDIIDKNPLEVLLQGYKP